MGNELLLYPFEVEISSVTKEFLAVVFVANIDRIPAQQPQQLGKGVSVAIRHRRREDRRRAYQAFAVETGEEVVWLREEEGKAEREVVWGVGRVVENVARDLEFAMADGHEDALLVELRDELGDCVRQSSWVSTLSITCNDPPRDKRHTVIELSVCKQTHKVRPVSWYHIVPLQMQRNVSKGLRVAIDVERSDRSSWVLAFLLRRSDLAKKVLRKIGRCCSDTRNVRRESANEQYQKEGGGFKLKLVLKAKGA